MHADCLQFILPFFELYPSCLRTLVILLSHAVMRLASCHHLPLSLYSRELAPNFNSKLDSSLNFTRTNNKCFASFPLVQRRSMDRRQQEIAHTHRKKR